jgi:suppressor for copper-sensitivity B
MLYIFRNLFFIFSLFFFTNAVALESNWVSGIESKVRLISPITSNDKPEFFLGLEYKLQDGWKTYWKSPGDGGFPQEIDWSNSVNIKNLEIEWPIPKNFEIFGLESIGYVDNVIFPLKLSLKDASKPSLVILNINYLVCKDICIPGKAHLELNIPSGESNLTKYFFILEKAISSLPQKNLELSFLRDSETKVYSDDDYISIEYSAKAKKIFKNPSIFLHTKYGLPVIDPVIEVSANSKNINAKFIFNKDLIKDKIINTQIIIKDTNKNYLSDRVMNVENKEIIKNNNFLFYMFIGFLGGLILNGMPCVLPVLSIKLFSVMKHMESRSSIRKSFLLTSLGIICSFILLAISFIIMRYFGYSIGWGIQFQQPIFLMSISLILTLFALNLFGLYEITTPNFVNSKYFSFLQNNYNTRDFFNGFFATLMATPCSAPFVGTALTFAFTQSSFSLFYIFISMGFGMASPYIFISIFPQMLKFLPKPGSWMIYLKHFLGLLLLLTILWICSILLNHYNYYFLLISFILVTAVIILNYFFQLRKIFALVAIGIFFILPNFSFFSSNFYKIDSDWLDFNLVNIEKLIQEDNIVFVDVTADWCATCQFNKINVLNSSLVKEVFLKFKVIKVRADWTKPNKKIENYLQNNKKFGIPYNVIYNKKNINGIDLSELLSVKEVLETLNNL